MSRTRKVERERSRIPSHSTFFDKVVPWLLLVLAVITALMIVVAAGVLLGLVPYR